MAVKIAKGAGDLVQIGNRDYPLNAFSVQYSNTGVMLIPKYKNLLQAPYMSFKYVDLVDEDDAPIGTDEETVRPALQELLYSGTAAE